MFASWMVVLGMVCCINILWAVTVRYRFVSVNAAGVGPFVSMLKWLTCPGATFYLWWNGDWVDGIFALLWPLVAVIVAAIPPTRIGIVQKQFMAKLGYTP